MEMDALLVAALEFKWSVRHLESCALSSDSSQCERSCMDPTKASQPTAVMVASQTTSSF